jgi:HAD superfamily hydrolase (TIGR01509 family)
MAEPGGISRRVPQADAPGDIGLVILDFDGVVADSEIISLSSLRAALSEFGLHLKPDQVRHRYLGVAIDKIERDIDKESPLGTSAGFSQIWHNTLFERFRSELIPVPGLVDLLNRIEVRGLPYCIASSSTFERIGIALDAMGLTKRFKHIFSAQQVERGKPAPDLFLHAAKGFDILPGKCVVVEDSPHGIRAAKAAGMCAVGFLGGAHLNDIRDEHRRTLMGEGADRVVESLDEILVDEVNNATRTAASSSAPAAGQ